MKLASAQPIAVSCENCVAMTGMSWKWCVRFARANDVPLWRIGPRKHVIPAAPLAAALERAAVAQPPTSTADEVAQLKAQIAAALR